MKALMKSPIPAYQKVKEYILSRVAAGEWKPGEQVPSEYQLVDLLGFSRATIIRALRELTAENYLDRVAGVGTFVAELQPRMHSSAVLNIADEIEERGGEYTSKIHLLEEIAAPEDLARAMDIPTDEWIYHSVIVHLEDGVPLQLEDRYVSPEVVPNYLDIDFEQMTPGHYLLEVAPLQEVEHIVEAVMPDATTQQLLKMKRGEPCLKVQRRTWAFGRVASVADLYYPGSRYQWHARKDTMESDGTTVARRNTGTFG